ncbi:MAG: glycosyltransferase [Sphingorhabdus sp.]
MPRNVVIAVPARNECDLISSCLRALDIASATVKQCSVAIVVLVNNSSDKTAQIARRFAARHARLFVEETWFDPAVAHAGTARKKAMDRAAVLAGHDGILMTTDADSEVSPDWIAANLVELSQGVDAVAGTIAFKPHHRLKLLPMLMARKQEWELAGLQARLATLLDPLPYDPWPTHIWEWGASLAITTEAYRAIGGLPCVPIAEDRALATALFRNDRKLRHSHAPIVHTSPRLAGRAPMGFADLLRDYCSISDTCCDAALEPTRDLARRLSMRHAARKAHNRHEPFGKSWLQIEASDRRLTRKRVFPQRLDAEITIAKTLIARLEEAERRPADNSLCAVAA